jgi:hypothetical protein
MLMRIVSAIRSVDFTDSPASESAQTIPVPVNAVQTKSGACADKGSKLPAA